MTSLNDEDGYVWQPRLTMVKVKIPEGCVKCPTCKGTGKMIDMGDRDSMACLTCMGQGYAKKEWIEELLKKYGELK